MSLSTDQQFAICRILRVTPIALEAQIAWLASRVTTDLVDVIQVEIARWDDGAGTKFTKLHPNVANKGVETFPDEIKNDIRGNIATYLERPDWASAASSVMVEMIRG